MLSSAQRNIHPLDKLAHTCFHRKRALSLDGFVPKAEGGEGRDYHRDVPHSMSVLTLI